MNPDSMYISERPGRIYLMSIEGQPYVATAGSREEMDLKLTSMGLEAGWEDGIGLFNRDRFYGVRRMR
jgi:hypothetical protein